MLRKTLFALALALASLASFQLGRGGASASGVPSVQVPAKAYACYSCGGVDCHSHQRYECPQCCDD